MTVAVAPPLRPGVGARGDRQHVARRSGRRRSIRWCSGPPPPASACRPRRSRGRRRTRPRARGCSTRSTATSQSGDQPVTSSARIVEGQPREIAGRQREQVDVAAAGARRGEGEALAVGRIQRPRLGRRVRHEQAGVAAARAALPRCRRRSRRRWSTPSGDTPGSPNDGSGAVAAAAVRVSATHRMACFMRPSIRPAWPRRSGPIGRSSARLVCADTLPGTDDLQLSQRRVTDRFDGDRAIERGQAAAHRRGESEQIHVGELGMAGCDGQIEDALVGQ